MLRRCSSLLVQRRYSKVHENSRSPAFTSFNNTQEKWDLFAGVIVERLPILSKEFNEIEKEFQQYLWRVEFEKSLKSKHELQHELDLKQADLLKKGKMELDLDESASKQTAQDLKDAYIEEFNKFKPSSRITPDDKNKVLMSTNRCLDEALYLLVEHKLGSKHHLLLPQGPRLEGETMRQAAERILREKCGEQMKTLFYSNAPCGFYKYKYPVAGREKSVGAKIFFFRTVLKNGNVDKAFSTKYEWLQKNELTTKLNPSYSDSVEKFLI